ncbi:MAG: hypothetical protein DMG48_11480 [Acidobacteria bacterium]|nr:MAG: hypothetical protein DMG48_11480 [Acidobacteriota bacterium]
MHCPEFFASALAAHFRIDAHPHILQSSVFRKLREQRVNFRPHLPPHRNADQHKSENAEARAESRHEEVVSLSEARGIQHERKKSVLLLRIFLLERTNHAVGDFHRNCRQSPRELQLMIVRRSLHQQQPLVHHQRHDLRANFVVVAGIHLLHSGGERFLSLDFQEIPFGNRGIPDRDQLGTLHRERSEHKVVSVPPACCKK